MSDTQNQDVVQPTDEGAPVDTGTPVKPADSPSASEGGWSLPKEYAEAAWAEGVTSEADLYKKISELHEKASAPVDAEAYLEKLKLASPADYELPEYFKGEETAGKLQEMLHNAGLTKAQADKLLTSYAEFDKAQQDDLFGAEGFKEELAKSFGKDEEAPKMVAAALAKGLSAEDQKLLENMPNPVVGLLYRSAHALIKAYGVEDGGPVPASDTAAATPEARRAEAHRLWSQIDELQKKGDFAQIREIRQKLDALYKG